MRRYLFSSACLHFAALGVVLLLQTFQPAPPIWFEGTGFDVYAPGGGGGTDKGPSRPAGAGLKEEKRGQPVPQPVEAPVPDKPAPKQEAQRAAEKWDVKDAKEEKAEKPEPKETAIPESAPRGETAQKKQTNVIRRGVAAGSSAGEGEFDFEGTGTGGRGLGAGIGSGGSGFGFGGYLAAMRQRIWREWLQYATFGTGKAAVVRLTVGRDGYISDLKLDKSSGDSLFDNQAMKAVRNSQPLPPLPVNFPRDQQDFRLQFRLLE